MIETLTALAEPTRLQIVALLRDGPQPVGEIGARLRLPQPAVSKHLRVLRDAGLVSVAPHAQQRIYGLNAAPLQALHAWLEGYRQLWDERFAQLDAVLAQIQAQKPT